MCSYCAALLISPVMALARPSVSLFHTGFYKFWLRNKKSLLSSCCNYGRQISSFSTHLITLVGCKLTRSTQPGHPTEIGESWASTSTQCDVVSQCKLVPDQGNWGQRRCVGLVACKGHCSVFWPKFSRLYKSIWIGVYLSLCVLCEWSGDAESSELWFCCSCRH